MNKKLFKTKALFVLSLAAAVTLACKKTDPNLPREEQIDVFRSLDDQTPLQEAFFSVKGGTSTFFFKSNVEGLSVKWLDGKNPAWAKVDKIVPVSDGIYAVTMTCDPITARADTVDASGSSLGLYQKRTGNLMITKADQYLGKYFVIHQGFTKRVGTDFSWLEYGSDNPNENISEAPIEAWTAQQKAKGYTSTLIPGQDDKWCYGKKGYIRLGNSDRFGADFKIPYVNNFSYDSLLVVSFKAVHQIGYSTGEFIGETEGMGTELITPFQPEESAVKSSEDRKVDDDVLIVEVSGGGVFRMTDGSTPTSLTLHLGTYDMESPDFPKDIFKDSSYLLFLCSTPNNPISSNTNIRFIAGSMNPEPMKNANRVFIDDLYVYRMAEKLDEDLFELNGRVSGPDKVLGGR